MALDLQTVITCPTHTSKKIQCCLSDGKQYKTRDWPVTKMSKKRKLFNRASLQCVLRKPGTDTRLNA